jgi:hypothetical protein
MAFRLRATPQHTFPNISKDPAPFCHPVPGPAISFASFSPGYPPHRSQRRRHIRSPYDCNTQHCRAKALCSPANPDHLHPARRIAMSETRPGGRKCKTYPDELEKRVGTSHDDLAAKPLPLPLESTLGAYQWRAREREISCSRPEETAPACSRRSRCSSAANYQCGDSRAVRTRSTADARNSALGDRSYEAKGRRAGAACKRSLMSGGVWRG